MATSKPLVGSRLHIIPFTEEHITPRYIAWLNDPEVVRFSQQRHKKHTAESCRAYLQSFAKTPNFFWAVLAKDKTIGHIGNLTAYIDPLHKVADVGILIGEKTVWGQGYGSEAWLVVCTYLFEECDMRKITAGTLSVNESMLALMRKTGMKEDGKRIRQSLWNGQEVDMIHAAFFRDHWPRS